MKINDVFNVDNKLAGVFTNAVANSPFLTSILLTSDRFGVVSSSIIISFSFEISSFLGYPNNQEYVKWFSIIVGIDAVCSIVFAKLRYENKALKFSLVRVMSIAINIFAVLSLKLISILSAKIL